ncbi:MAG TPA: M48 family metallopeptidase [Acidobacteriaceae bacterium]|jgi:Zn-dependent protease with chaperone function|nr:M48 family metallopeptidase [Acidobacteriaceae bacterium]
MSTLKTTLNVVICGGLALSGAWMLGQSSSTPATPAPTATTPAATAPSASQGQQAPAADSGSTQVADASAMPYCPGPVLHRAPGAGGDICSSGSSGSPSGQGTSDESESSDSKVAKNSIGQTDSNINPFKQVEPLPDGTMPGVKKGSIEDVSAVGERSIGARGMGNWYSADSEIKMGKQYADEIEKSTRFITDPVVTEYINRIGQNIVKNSDCKVPFTIKVIDTDEINAMALPGGFFYVNSGLILAADEEAELAGVMAHETAHVCAHHAAREMTRANYAQIGMVPLIMMTGYSWTGYGIYEATQLLIPITFLEFSREFEAQADYLGVQYMYRAGYDPQAFVTFFEKIQNLEKTKPGAVARVFENHPQTPDRIEHTEEEIATILPPRDQYLVTTSEFNDVKARLARIENKRRILDNKKGKPSLRRVSSNGSGDSTDSNSTGDQPTLHRRDDTNSN